MEKIFCWRKCFVGENGYMQREIYTKYRLENSYFVLLIIFVFERIVTKNFYLCKKICYNSVEFSVFYKNLSIKISEFWSCCFQK